MGTKRKLLTLTGGSKNARAKKDDNKSVGGKYALAAQDNGILRKVSNWPALESCPQSPEVTIPIADQFPHGGFPIGCVHDYEGKHASRSGSAEKRDKERRWKYDYENIRRAAECHRQVRKYAQSFIRPGIKLIDLVQRLEAKSRELIGAKGLKCGWGFPTGCSLNWIAAHYTPNYGDNIVLKYDDVCKLDFGVQVGGRIVDCAFTVAFNERYDPLIEATQTATNVGIKEAGIDVRVSDIGAAISEVIESYEVELDGKMFAVKPIRNLTGHSMAPYQIHAGKSVPMLDNHDQTKMEEGEFYAIETFASTGRGYASEDLDCSHYMKVFDAPKAHLRFDRSKALLRTIDERFGTLAFCRRWLHDFGETRHLMALKDLVDNGIVQPYPPLCDIKGSYSSQMEHTILLRPTCKEVVSRGPDY